MEREGRSKEEKGGVRTRREWAKGKGRKRKGSKGKGRKDDGKEENGRTEMRWK